MLYFIFVGEARDFQALILEGGFVGSWLSQPRQYEDSTACPDEKIEEVHIWSNDLMV